MELALFASFFGDLFGGIKSAVTDPMVLPLLTGLAIKHLDKVPGIGAITKRIPNGAIPIINLAISAVAPSTAATALAATGVHQIARQVTRWAFDRLILRSSLDSKALAVAKAIGPGDRASI